MGIYEIKKTKNDGFLFNLKATNGEVIATSQTYASISACKNGIKSVGANAPDAPVEDQTVDGYTVEKNPKFEIYKDKKEEFRFRLKATNGQIIAVGEGYTNKVSCKNGIRSVKKNAVTKEIIEIV